MHSRPGRGRTAFHQKLFMDLISGDLQHLSGDKRLSKAKLIRPQDRFRTDIPIKAGNDIYGVPGLHRILRGMRPQRPGEREGTSLSGKLDDLPGIELTLRGEMIGEKDIFRLDVKPTPQTIDKFPRPDNIIGG